jgi:hypothetical protein
VGPASLSLHLSYGSVRSHGEVCCGEPTRSASQCKYWDAATGTANLDATGA